MKKENLIVTLLVVVILLSAASLYGVFAKEKIETGKTINAAGVAKMQVKPDIAYITIGVNTTDSTVESALQENNKKMNAIIAALKVTGIKDEDLQTVNFWVNTEFNYNIQPPKQTGYTVINNVTVKTTPEKVPSVISTAAQNGANNFYDFKLEVSNEEELKSSLMAEAIEDAKKKAEALASASNKKLGGFRTISYDFVPETQYYPYYGTGGAEGYAPVQAGQNEIKVTVYVVFEVN
jgi:hypothetical protein